jgi:hypothetical protein
MSDFNRISILKQEARKPESGNLDRSVVRAAFCFLASWLPA